MRMVIGVTLVLTGCGVDYDIARGELGSEGDEEVVEPDVDPRAEAEETEDQGLMAKCSVSPNPVEPPFEAATWDGSASEDFDGREIVSYSWELVSAPAGSAVSLPYTDQAVITGFVPDLAGAYVAALTVTNDAGVSETCEATLESIPAENLWIEMSWTIAPDDMDLHLLRPGGILETEGDCYYANCDSSNNEIPPLRWGSSTTADDPNLDLDDTQATGPENINIAEPYPGIYTVVVHDYTYTWGQPNHWGDNEVTVNIYIDGQMVWTDTRTISGEDEYVYFAEIDWNTGIVYDR